MLGFDKFFENKTLLYSAGAAAFLVAALLILFIFRLAFGRRLHMPGGGRSRQPRLGVVDAFDLDRQRQLVLVRRDNVEHLVMIGGPNDVLIESQIVRAEARDLQRPRDKEPTVAPLPWPAGGPSAGQAAPSIASEPKLPPAPEPAVAAKDVAPAPVTPAAPAPAPVPAIGAPVPPVPRPPFLPLPPRRPITTPSFKFKPGGDAPAVPPSSAAAEGGQPLSAPAVPLRPQGPAPSLASPSFLRPPQRPLQPAPGPVPPPVAPAPPLTQLFPGDPAPSTAPTIVPPAPRDTEAEKATKQADALESLEEEMAKLLGRPAKD